jgi:hypothetical protein
MLPNLIVLGAETIKLRSFDVSVSYNSEWS